MGGGVCACCPCSPPSRVLAPVARRGWLALWLQELLEAKLELAQIIGTLEKVSQRRPIDNRSDLLLYVAFLSAFLFPNLSESSSLLSPVECALSDQAALEAVHMNDMYIVYVEARDTG